MAGFIPYVLAFLFALIVSVLVNRFLLNKRLVNGTTIEVSKKTVVVTGCSSGIGYDAVKALIADGFTVFAGVRKQADFDKLAADVDSKNKKNLKFIQLDVTNDQHITDAVATVKASLNNGTLYALINNAGYSETASLEMLSSAQLKKQFDTNVFGQVAVTNAFLPLLRAANEKKDEPRSRIVFVSSFVGLINIPGAGAYCASKHALEALADSYRCELASWNIQVSILEPGAISTEFSKTLTTTATANLGLGEEKKGDEKKSDCQVDAAVAAKYREAFLKRTVPPYMTTQVTTAAILEILYSTAPLHRYRAGRDVNIGAWALRAIPSFLSDKLLGRAFK